MTNSIKENDTKASETKNGNKKTNSTKASSTKVNSKKKTTIKKSSASKKSATSNHSNNLYAAYGSNLSVSQMSYRCPDAKVIGTGKIMDYKLVFRYHADIEKHDGAFVPVLIWSISKDDEKRLDKYEGIKGGYYHQEKVTVVMDDVMNGIMDDGEEITANKEITAMVYIMNTQDTIEPPDFRYHQIIEGGYTDFGFDKKILKESLRESMRARWKRVRARMKRIDGGMYVNSDEEDID